MIRVSAESTMSMSSAIPIQSILEQFKIPKPKHVYDDREFFAPSGDELEESMSAEDCAAYLRDISKKMSEMESQSNKSMGRKLRICAMMIAHMDMRFRGAK